jgi:hypothetical protein
VHFLSRIPEWAYRALAALGGFGFLFQQLIMPMLKSLATRLWNRHDARVWEILRQPNPKPEHITGGKTYYRGEIPYPVELVIEKAARSKRSVLASLHRLERLGKVKDVHGGWQRKES